MLVVKAEKVWNLNILLFKPSEIVYISNIFSAEWAQFYDGAFNFYGINEMIRGFYSFNFVQFEVVALLSQFT